MKRQRLSIELSEEQQLILALLVVILVAVSMLYCLGFASVVLRENWVNAPFSLDENDSSLEEAPMSSEPIREPTLQATEVP